MQLCVNLGKCKRLDGGTNVEPWTTNLNILTRPDNFIKADTDAHNWSHNNCIQVFRRGLVQVHRQGDRVGGGGGQGDGPREGDGGGQGQGQPKVLQTYGGRAADGRPEEGQRETRMETKGDQYFNICQCIFYNFLPVQFF